jgi:hypothetical protein
MTESSTMTTETVGGNNNNDLEAAVVVAALFAARSDTTTMTTETVTVGGNNNDNAETAVAVPFAARSVTTLTDEHEHEKQAVFVSVSDNNSMVCHPDVTVTNNQTPGPDPDHARRGNTKRCRGGSCGMGVCFCLVVAFALLVALGILTTLGFPRQSHHEVEQTYTSYSNLDSGTGYPVWSDDGTAIAGVDKYWNNGIIFPPLEGRWIGRVNPRFRVIVVGVVDNDNNNEDADADANVSATTTTINDEEPATLLTEVTQHASSLYYMKRAGYVLVNYVSGFQASLLVPIDDSGNKNGRTQSTEYLSNIGLFGSSSAIYTAIPSRDGATIAAISWSEHSRASEVDYFAYNIDFKVAFIDAVTMETIGGGEGEQEAGQPVISFRAVVAMYSPTEPHSTHWPFFYWEEDHDHVVDSSVNMNGTIITNSTSTFETSDTSTSTQPHSLLFHMTDLVDFSIALHSDGSGTVVYVDVPTCVPFPTSSGPVRRELNNNARAVVDEAGERIEVVANWELEDPYCY